MVAWSPPGVSEAEGGGVFGEERMWGARPVAARTITSRHLRGGGSARGQSVDISSKTQGTRKSLRGSTHETCEGRRGQEAFFRQEKIAGAGGAVPGSLGDAVGARKDRVWRIPLVALRVHAPHARHLSADGQFVEQPTENASNLLCFR